MESILPSYRDPLFSIMLIIVLSLMIAVVTYIWSAYTQQKEKSTLRKFLEKFDNGKCTLDTSTMTFDPVMFSPLVLLAKGFENSGEYTKAINIYLYLIKHTTNAIDKDELMERLGQTYLRAGFLERARTIFAEVLHKRPRNKQVLIELGIVYEMMRQFDKALEVIEPLKILGEKTKELENFLCFEKIIASKESSSQEKMEQILVLFKEDNSLYRPVVSFLLKYDLPKAWSIIDTDFITLILDLLWFLPYVQIDMERVNTNNTLQAIYYARGDLRNKPDKCGIFTIDLLVSARANGLESEGDLIFSYLCTKCKQNFPMPFSRCPNCFALNKMEVEEEIVPKVLKYDNSLQ